LGKTLSERGRVYPIKIIKMKILFLVIIMSVYCINCTSHRVDEKTKDNYSEILSIYPEYLVSHFPTDISKDIFLFGNFTFPRGRYLNGIQLGVLKKNKEISELQQQVASISKAVYLVTDSCLIKIVQDVFDGRERLTLDNKQCNSATEIFPIPDFDFFTAPKQMYSAFENGYIYVLDAKKGKFLPDSCIARDNIGLPEEWAHGYTKGILISGEIVIYWLELW
jgi:hypothetical protein